ncbi:sugar porter family MFS transporter [Actinacidiphila soli]|uniref:sugar porter family MFS transporter n=1 Tax=Actinacidiphila soli TaxID=2487275 RepID=UPI0019D28E7D|nr:sugar porter family MFS transporter [Actinacidiphila soli]
MTDSVPSPMRASARREARLPWAVLGPALVAAIGGFLFGYDTGVISAALLYLTPAFHLSDQLQQVVVASLLLGAIVGVLIAGPLVDRAGRRRMLVGTAAVFGAAALVSAFAPNPGTLIGARFFLGVAIGAASLVVPTYIAEMAPKSVRGRLVSLQQLMITVGIFVSYLVGYAFSASGGWRWMLGLAAVPAVVMFFGLLSLAESPRWLLARGRDADARQIMIRSRSAEEADEEIAQIKALAAAENRLTSRDLFAPTLRPAILLGTAVAATNQLVGVNAVIYYTPTLLQRTGFGSSAAILSTVGIGLVNMIVTVVALSLVDRLGRRPLLLGGTVVVVLDLVFLGALYLLPSQRGVVGVLTVLALYVYIAAFAASLGLGIWLINSEIFPTSVRGKAAGFGTVTHWGLDFIISLTVLTTINLLTATGLFWLYAVFGVVGFAYLQAHAGNQGPQPGGHRELSARPGRTPAEASTGNPAPTRLAATPGPQRPGARAQEGNPSVIVVCGETLLDLTPAMCEGVAGYVPRPGGSPFNVAVEAARLGIPVAFLGRLSLDFWNFHRRWLMRWRKTVGGTSGDLPVGRRTGRRAQVSQRIGQVRHGGDGRQFLPPLPLILEIPQIPEYPSGTFHHTVPGLNRRRIEPCCRSIASRNTSSRSRSAGSVCRLMMRAAVECPTRPALARFSISHTGGAPAPSATPSSAATPAPAPAPDGPTRPPARCG